MKIIFTLLLAGLLTAGVMCSCGNNADFNDNSNETVQEETLKEGWTYSEKKLVGAWEFQYEMTGEYYGYRFNEDGTLDELYNRMNSPMGFYECRQDGVHYSPDGETWDEIVMVIKSLTDTELVVDFNGVETKYTRYDGEITKYMPEGWTYVEG